VTQDFAKIRPEPLLERQPVEAPPAWSLMVTGVVVGITVGVFACVLFYLSGNVPPLNIAQPAQAATTNFTEQTDMPAENEADAAVDFEFYTELPRYEVPTDSTPVEIASEEITGTFMLQTGAFQLRESADQEMQRQMALGLNVIVKSEELPGRTLFLVQTGPYSTSAQLNEAEQLLSRNNIASLTIQLQ
jgi:cell division protein FtsN